MTIQVVGADELAQIIEQTVEATVNKVLQRKGVLFEPSDVMTSDELLEYLNRYGVRISKQTVFGYTHRGEIPYHKVGKNLRFKREEIDKWLEEYCSRGRSHKGDKSGAVEALANSAAEIAKRN